MSIMEKIMLISTCLMPIITLMMFLPRIVKLKKVKKSKPAPEPVSVKEEKLSSTPTKVSKSESRVRLDDDFKNFAEIKKNRVSAPKRNFPNHSFGEFSDRFMPPRPTKTPEKEKTVSEEFNSLSPQLKALILSGALDRKNFDE